MRARGARTWRMLAPLLAVWAGSLGARTLDVAFTAALTNGTDWVYGEKVKLAAADHVYLNANGSEVRSPVFPGAVVGVSFRAYGSGASRPRTVSLVPCVADGGGAVREVDAADARAHTLADASGAVASNHVWRTEDGVVGFVVRAGEGGQSFHLLSATVTLDEREPTGLAADEVFSDAFTARWTSDPRAVAATLCVTQRLETAAAFRPLAGCDWDFSTLPSPGGAAVRLDDALPLDWPGLSGERLLQAANTNGFLQIGTTKTNGVLRVDAVPRAATHLLLRAAVRNESYGRTMPLDWCAATATNRLATLTLSTAMTDFALPLADVPSDASLLLHSTRNSGGPVCLEHLRLVADYAPPGIELREASRVEVGRRATCRIRLPGPGTYLWSVRSRLDDGTVTPFAPWQTLILPPDAPRAPTGFSLRFR